MHFTIDKSIRVWALFLRGVMYDMDFNACSRCTHAQSDYICDAHMILEYYTENGLNEIFFRHGAGCHCYADNLIQQSELQ